jgi:hypothetical protein
LPDDQVLFEMAKSRFTPKVIGFLLKQSPKLCESLKDTEYARQLMSSSNYKAPFVLDEVLRNAKYDQQTINELGRVRLDRSRYSISPHFMNVLLDNGLQVPIVWNFASKNYVPWLKAFIVEKYGSKNINSDLLDKMSCLEKSYSLQAQDSRGDHLRLLRQCYDIDSDHYTE